MIVCSALKIKNYYGPNKDLLVSGLRHSDCFKILKEFRVKIKRTEVEQGFIDHNGKFYNREDAYMEARSCGQLPIALRDYKRKDYDDELYSEDLY